MVPAGQPSMCPFPATTADIMDNLSSDLNTNKAVVKKAEIAIIILAIAVFCLLLVVGTLTFFMCRKKPSDLAAAVEMK